MVSWTSGWRSAAIAPVLTSVSDYRALESIAASNRGVNESPVRRDLRRPAGQAPAQLAAEQLDVVLVAPVQGDAVLVAEVDRLQVPVPQPMSQAGAELVRQHLLQALLDRVALGQQVV